MTATALKLGVVASFRAPKQFAVIAASLAVACFVSLVEFAFWTGVSSAHLGVIAHVHADLVLLNARRSNLNRWDSFPEGQLARVKADPSVASVAGVWQEGVRMQASQAGPYRRIVAIGIDASVPGGGIDLQPELIARLRAPGTVAFDRGSRDLFGAPREGDEIWVENMRMRVVGSVAIGPSLVNDGNLIMSSGNLQSFSRGASPLAGLIWLHPGERVEEVAHRLVALVGAEASVMSRSTLLSREQRYLSTVAPVGLLFSAGAVAGGVVGLVLSYQVFFGLILRQRKAVATLKAMGMAPGHLVAWVLPRAAMAGASGFLVGWLFAELVCWAVRRELSMDISLPAAHLLGAAVAAVCICMFAAWLALKRVNSDPAELLY